MIGERLYDLRKDAGLTQDELADILKINKHSVSSYEREKSEPPDVIKISIAKFFNVSVDYLVGLSDRPLPSRDESLYVRLPASFPADKINNVIEFANYLIYKQKSENQK